MQVTFNLGHLDKWRDTSDPFIIYNAMDTNGGIVNTNTKYNPRH